MTSKRSIKKKGEFEGIVIFESSLMGRGFNSAGICLPGIGIIVGLETYSNQCDMEVVRHEFGHVLQARKLGIAGFYLFIAIPSLLSAWTNGFGAGHQNFWTERWANHLASEYFYREPWPVHRFPAKDLGKRSKQWLLIEE